MRDQAVFDTQVAQVARWLADHPGRHRAAEVAGGLGIYSDTVRDALRHAERKGLVQSYRGADFQYWQAGPKAAALPPLPVRQADAHPVMTARVKRGTKIAGWLGGNPGFHAVGMIAREFLFSRWDLIDALEAAEELGVVQSRPGARGMREWAAADVAVETVSTMEVNQ